MGWMTSRSRLAGAGKLRASDRLFRASSGVLGRVSRRARGEEEPRSTTGIPPS